MNALRLPDIDFKKFRGKACTKNEGNKSNECALDACAPIEFSVYIPRALGVTEVNIILKNDTCGKESILQAVWTDILGDLDLYTITISLDVALYFFRFSFKSGCKTFYGYRGDKNEIIFYSKVFGKEFQLTVSDFKHTEPNGFNGGIIYHVFVDRFARSDKCICKKNAIIADFTDGIPEYPEYPGAPLKNNTFWGGNLYGVIDKLDYIASLGANILYFSPIFESPSNHKYDTGDYLKVDEMFGSDEALDLLIKEAHKRGIKIILDGVFNHTGADSIYFNRYGSYDSIGAYQSKDSPYYSWYDFRSHPNEYTCWWDIEILPRINTRNQECADFFVGDSGLVSHYAKKGIDGFRLDVADELSDDFIAQIKSRLEEDRPGSILYGEVWEDASNKIAYSERKRYYLGDELDGVMNYPVRSGIIDYVLKGETNALNYALTDVLTNAPKRIRDLQMNLLGTHDTERIITLLGGGDATGLKNESLVKKRLAKADYKNSKRLLKLAYTILATIPGIPSIFYGDEAGLEGYGDPFNRMPYPWGREDLDILDFYKKIGIIRREHPVYKDGDFEIITLTAERFAFKRTNDKSTILTIINNSERKLCISFSSAVEAKISSVYSDKIILAPKTAEICEIQSKDTYLFFDSSKEI